MEGYLQLRINPWLRRLLTRLIAIVPAVLVILIYGEEKVDDLLVFSQVVLSLQLGFAVIPLIHFVSDKATMGSFAIKTYVKIAAWLVAIILVFLNVKLVAEQSIQLFESNAMWYWKLILVLGILAFACLFLVMTFLPIIKKRRQKQRAIMHGETVVLQNLTVKQTTRIAISLDFSVSDEKLIAYAIAQGHTSVTYILLHVVESVSARYSGEASDDEETREDKQRLENYVMQLQKMGYTAEFTLGYRSRVKEIIRIVKESKADMLVMGAHRHSGLKDYIFGETIEDVRHALAIPVLIVNL
jgi:manganese transport protein